MLPAFYVLRIAAPPPLLHRPWRSVAECGANCENVRRWLSGPVGLIRYRHEAAIVCVVIPCRIHQASPIKLVLYVI